jgi:hypothetical protein
MLKENMMSDSNPYNAVVSAIPLDDEFLDKPGEEAVNVWEVILNVGKDSGISLNNAFLIFALGPEVKDPQSGASLGHYEIVRGKARVVHLQHKMCTVRSNRIITRRIQNALLAATGSPALNSYEETAPFEEIAVGDFARLIS